MPLRPSPKPVSGSAPEEQYAPATRKSMHLDKPTSHGGWPSGEYDPPVKDRLYSWYKKMKMMPEQDEHAEYIEPKEKPMRITESQLRRIVREEYGHMLEAETKTPAETLHDAFKSKTFKTVAEMQAAKEQLASGLSALGVKGEAQILNALKGGDAITSFAHELADMQGKQGMKESQRGNDQLGQHDNDTDTGDPYDVGMNEVRRLLRKAVVSEMRTFRRR